MSNLWDLSKLQARPGSVLDGDTIPAMFWNAVARRGDAVWLREKDDIKEFYLGMKDEGVRGERRWKKKKTWR